MYALDIRMGREVAETGLWKRCPVAERIWRSKPLIRVAQTLLRHNQIRLWQDQVIIKRARQGTLTDWHQDAPYWPMHETTALTCWIPLTHVDEASGGLRFVRSSHLLAINSQMLPIQLGSLPWKAADINGINGQGDLLQSVSLAPGDCTFHSGLVVHGANPNRSDRARLAYKFVYMPDGTTFRFQWHSATEGLQLRDGDRIAGPGFPFVS